MNINTNTLYMGLCVIALLILALNFGIWFYYRHSNPRRGGNNAPRSGPQVRRPWAEEEDNLKELSSRVDNLRRDPPDEPGSTPKEPKPGP